MYSTPSMPASGFLMRMMQSLFFGDYTMPNQVIEKQMKGNRVQLCCGNEYAQFSKQLNKSTFIDIITQITHLAYLQGQLEERDKAKYESKIADICKLEGHIRENYLYRFVK